VQNVFDFSPNSDQDQVIKQKQIAMKKGIKGIYTLFSVCKKEEAFSTQRFPLGPPQTLLDEQEVMPIRMVNRSSFFIY
jgi:hypothetical protein